LVPAGEPFVVYEGRSIGHKAICPFPPVLIQKIEVVPDRKEADRIGSIKVYKI
jgi:hypothetical protein